MIKHIWFDFSGTLVDMKEQEHNKLRYGTYAEVVKKPFDENLIIEYEKAFLKQGSNAGVFRALGMPSDFWGKKMEGQNTKDLFFLKDPLVPEVLSELKKSVPISLFTNIKPSKILTYLNIPATLFENILQAGDYKEPKPALDGFKKMIELSGLAAETMVYVGDSVVKDIRPAKSLNMKTCLLWAKSSEADWSFEKIQELMELIK